MSTPDDRRYFFPKEEKLCSKKIISDLFEHGASFRMGVLKFFYLSDIDPQYQQVPVQVAFSVPKRSFKRAFLRNRLKRRMRESYRLNKYLLLPTVEKRQGRVAVFVKLSVRNEVPYAKIEHAMKKGLSRIKREFLAH